MLDLKLIDVVNYVYYVHKTNVGNLNPSLR